MDLLKDGEDGDRIDGDDQRGEEKRLEDTGRIRTEHASETTGVQRGALNDKLDESMIKDIYLK